MIFVTVGTHEQPFNRLIEYIDELKKTNVLHEDVIAQIGYGTYEPRYCSWSRLYSYSEMDKFMDDARIIITHGGPASFIMPIKRGKVPIVVPRKKIYGEHVNDHQTEFALLVKERMDNIIVVENVMTLEDYIINYDNLVSEMKVNIQSNTIAFNKKLDKLINEMF